jgi:hypothetical protein
VTESIPGRVDEIGAELPCGNARRHGGHELSWRSGRGVSDRLPGA